MAVKWPFFDLFAYGALTRIGFCAKIACYLSAVLISASTTSMGIIASALLSGYLYWFARYVLTIIFLDAVIRMAVFVLSTII